MPLPSCFLLLLFIVVSVSASEFEIQFAHCPASCSVSFVVSSIEKRLSNPTPTPLVDVSSNGLVFSSVIFSNSFGFAFPSSLHSPSPVVLSGAVQLALIITSSSSSLFVNHSLIQSVQHSSVPVSFCSSVLTVKSGQDVSDVQFWSLDLFPLHVTETNFLPDPFSSSSLSLSSLPSTLFPWSLSFFSSDGEFLSFSAASSVSFDCEVIGILFAVALVLIALSILLLAFAVLLRGEKDIVCWCWRNIFVDLLFGLPPFLLCLAHPAIFEAKLFVCFFPLRQKSLEFFDSSTLHLR